MPYHTYSYFYSDAYGPDEDDDEAVVIDSGEYAWTQE